MYFRWEIGQKKYLFECTNSAKKLNNKKWQHSICLEWTNSARKMVGVYFCVFFESVIFVFHLAYECKWFLPFIF